MPKKHSKRLYKGLFQIFIVLFICSDKYFDWLFLWSSRLDGIVFLDLGSVCPDGILFLDPFSYSDHTSCSWPDKVSRCTRNVVPFRKKKKQFIWFYKHVNAILFCLDEKKIVATFLVWESIRNLAESKRKSYCIYLTPIDLEPNAIPFGSDSIGKW